MARIAIGLLIGWVAATGRSSTAAETKVDRHGDPLPPGAIARLGTTRLIGGASSLFSPDGRILAGLGGDQSVRLWDVETGALVHRLPPYTRGNQLAFSPDGAVLAVAGPPQIRLFDVESGRLTEKIPWRGDVAWLAFGRDGTSLLIATQIDTPRKLPPVHSLDVCRFDLNERKEVFRRDQYVTPATAALAPDGRSIAILTGKGLELLHADTGETLATGPAPEGLFQALQFDPDGKRLAGVGGLGNKDGTTVMLWDVATGELLSQFARRQPRTVRSNPVFLDDNRLAVSAGTLIEIWNIAEENVVEKIRPSSISIYRLVPSPNGKQWALSTQHRMMLWDVARGELRFPQSSHVGRVGWAVFSPDGRSVLTMSADRTAYWWDTRTGELIESASIHFEGHVPDDITAITLPDGREMKLGAGSYRPTLIDLMPTAESLLEGRGLMELTPDGRRAIVYLKNQRRVRLVDTDSGEEVEMSVRGSLSAGAISADGGRVVSYISGPPRDGHAELAVWDVAGSGKRAGIKPTEAFPSRREQLLRRRLSACGRMVVVAGARLDEIELYEADSGAHVGALPLGLDEEVSRLALSADGTLLAASAHQKVMLWDLATRERVAELEGHYAYVDEIVFSPDSKLLLTGSGDTTALIWDLHSLLPDDWSAIKPLTPEQVETAIQDLKHRDATVAHRSARSLALAGPGNRSALEERLEAIQPDWQRVERLIEQLQADEFTQRERATVELGKFDWRVTARLERQRQLEKLPEVRNRLEEALQSIRSKPASDIELQGIRIQWILQQIDARGGRWHP